MSAVRFRRAADAAHNPVEHPHHYTAHASGVECIEITRHMNFNLGNAVKYIWRADLKGDALEDLRKARFYIEDEIAKRERAASARAPEAGEGEVPSKKGHRQSEAPASGAAGR